MPDPSGPLPDLDETRVGDSSAGPAGDVDPTQLDPYATALPVQGPRPGPSTLQATVDDPFATRVGDIPTVSPMSLDPTVAHSFSGGPGGSSSARDPGGSRYQPVRLHARGGLGEIFVAVDVELNREVALKEIQERHVAHLDSQFRFVFEAEITGGLEHPGIVPVYGLGRHPDGRPYYAMRFIRGDTLKAAIKTFHDSAGGQPASIRHSLEFRQLLTRFVAVCHAIDYAHGRGVLHRDIKPDNIMLGPHGETLVVDWGLAKALDRPDPVDATVPRPLRPHSGNDTSATMAGSVMGTPSFMSPEQAAGEVETLGPAADIFSLGSTLYAMLVGEAPFRGKSLTALLEDVRNADFPPPRRFNTSISPALEAICLKAMALRSGDRYSTAAALAADIERWLADEPVLAYPEPWTVRASRWARRHRTAVAASFMLLLTASTALAISNVLIGRERARTERNFQRARSAVEQMLTRVGEVDLADVPQMEGVRRDLLERALAFYREFLDERGNDPSSRLETGRALGRLGEIREMLGQYTQAEDDYRQALALLDRPAPSGDVEVRRALARARSNFGILLKKSNRFVESESFLRDSLRDRRALAAEHPGDADDARAASSTLYQLGTLLARLKDRSKEDEEAYRSAIREQEALASRPSDRPEDRRELARYLNNLGILQSGSDPDAAEATFRRALKIQDELEASSATNAGFRWQRARTWNNLAILFFNARLADEAAPAFARARQGFESLAADFPRVPDYRRELAIDLNNLALLLEARPSGDAKPANLLRDALAAQRLLVADFPEVPDHRMKLAITLLHLGDLLRLTDAVESARFLIEASALQEKLATTYPQVPEYQAALGRTLTERARSMVVAGKQADALELLTPAINALERARRGNPRDRTYVRFLVEAREDRAKVLLNLGRHVDLAAEAKMLAQVAPDRPEGHVLAARFLARCIGLAADDGSLSPASRAQLQDTYISEATDALRRAFDRGQEDATFLDGPDFLWLKNQIDFQKIRDQAKARGRKAAV